MDTIKELEERLKEEKLKQKWNEIQTKLREAITKYSGKAFGNKALRLSTLSKYKSKSFYITVVYIKEVVLNENIQTINDLRLYPDNYNCEITLRGESFSVFYNNENNTNINSSQNSSWRIKDMMDYCYEIPIETYNNIKALINNSIDNVFLTPFKELESHWSSFTGGLYCTKFLKENGCKFINLTDDEIYAINNHPFLYGNELLINDMSKKIIEDWKKEEIENDKRDVGFYCCGEYVKPTGISKRRIAKLDLILKKFKE